MEGTGEEPAPRHRRNIAMRIVAQDPSVRDGQEAILTDVRVPGDPFEVGPRSHRFHVVDFDLTADRYADGLPGHDGTDNYPDPFAGSTWGEIAAHPRFRDWFHAQNVYAIAARTLASFEAALGRRISWAFPGHTLHLVPHAFGEPEAYYSRRDRAILLGYWPTGSGTGYACLSHDIIAHETAHAVLDGLRPGLMRPGPLDQAAFHEALADIVALLAVGSIQDVVLRLLGSGPDGRISVRNLTEGNLARTAIFELARELGEVLVGRGAGLRHSAVLASGAAWREDPDFEEAHRRGEILVAATMTAVVGIWHQRMAPLLKAGARVDAERAAEEGAKACRHFLGMAIRALDYCPPVGLEFEDYLDALLVADAEAVPDDRYGYRDAVEEAFAAFDVTPAHRIAPAQADALSYDDINFGALQSQADEVARFAWRNAAVLGIERAHELRIEAVRPSVRVGPEGLVVRETVAHYVQSATLSGAELAAALGGEGAHPATEEDFELDAGGMLVFDPFGRLKYRRHKPLFGKHQRTRLSARATAGDGDEPFAWLHDPDPFRRERW